MKFRYILAALSLLLAASCQQEKIGTLSEVQLSESYVSINVEGGSATVGVLTTAAWEIDAASVPAWLTVNPMSGGAGSTNITFTAAKTKNTNNAEVHLKCAGKTQYINVIQYAAKGEVKIISVANALALIKAGGEAGTTYNLDGEYCVKGIVSKIDEISPSYGNATYYLSDDGKHENWLEVYRGAWLNGAAFTKGDEFAVGDELTIIGELMSYKGTPETKEKTAYVVAFEKSLIGVEAVDPEDATIEAEGGKVTVTLKNKGNGLYVEAPEDAAWLTIASVAGNKVTFSAAANDGGDREATIVFKTTDGTKDYSTQQTITQKGAIIDISVKDFLAAESGVSTPFRLTGVISRDYPSDKNGQSFYIKDWSGEVLVYRADNFKESALQIGDVVSVVGKRGDYKGSPQMVSGHIEAIVAIVEEISLADFLTKADSKDNYYMVTGTISSLKDDKGKDNDYGNMYITDGTNTVYVYGCYPGWGATGDNRKYLVRDNNLEVGDEITIIATKSSYNDVPQLNKGVCHSFKKANE